MLNRLIQIFVIIISFVLIIPALALTPITFVLFNYNLVGCMGVIFSNATFSEEWDYKTFLNYVK